MVRPEAIKLSDTKRGFPGQVVSSTYLGSKIDYLVRVGDQTLKVVQSDPSSGTRFDAGSAVYVVLPHIGVQILSQRPNEASLSELSGTGCRHAHAIPVGSRNRDAVVGGRRLGGS